MILVNTISHLNTKWENDRKNTSTIPPCWITWLKVNFRLIKIAYCEVQLNLKDVFIIALILLIMFNQRVCFYSLKSKRFDRCVCLSGSCQITRCSFIFSDIEKSCPIVYFGQLNRRELCRMSVHLNRDYARCACTKQHVPYTSGCHCLPYLFMETLETVETSLNQK